jgi:hypothetical protein
VYAGAFRILPPTTTLARGQTITVTAVGGHDRAALT